MKKEQILGIVRHILTFAGGFVVAKGLADAALMSILISVLIAPSSFLILATIGLRFAGPCKLIWAVRLNAAAIIILYIKISPEHKHKGIL